jgi:hypothetical protein
MLLGDGERWLAVLTAFLDESGTHAGCPAVTVAGFYGNKDQWELFRAVWGPHSFGFHAKDGASKYAELFGAIEASGINGIYFPLDKAIYRQNSTPQMLSRAGNEYSMCAFQCVLSICKEVGVPTAFVFEQGQPNLNFVLETLLYMLDSGGTCISSITPAKKSDFIELHPADFVSHLASSSQRYLKFACTGRLSDDLVVWTRTQEGDRWRHSQSCLAACCFLYTTVLTVW